MGGSNSTPRRITIEQDEESGVVKVSEAVGRRLLGKPDLVPKTTAPDSSRDSFPAKSSQPINPGVSKGELLSLQEKYESRIKVLESKNAEMYQSTTAEFAQAVKDVEAKFLKTTLSPVCQDLQEDVYRCYQENPRQTLNCSAQVRAFSECVQKQREKVLTRKG